MNPTSERPELIFVEAPPAGSGGRSVPRSPIALWLADLREHPNVWARYPERVGRTTPNGIITGGYSGIAAGEYEAVGRNLDPKKCDLYVRYIGADSASGVSQ